jgi:hypothetical protein
MTIVGTHRGAVSGKVHVHLLRETAAERAARAAATRQAGDGTNTEAPALQGQKATSVQQGSAV